MVRTPMLALGLGVALLLGGFAAGSEPAFLGGTSCHAVLHPGVGASPAGCTSPRNPVAETAVWSVLALGAALVLAGWTVGRDLDRAPGKPRPRTG
jgi:hypothetical protein